MQVDWKSKVKLLKDSFDSHLGGVVLLTPPLDGRDQPVQVTSDESSLTFEGKELKPKMVRRWLWEQRNCRAVTRPGAFIFASYDDSTDVTRVGLGALATTDAAVRLEGIRERSIA